MWIEFEKLENPHPEVDTLKYRTNFGLVIDQRRYDIICKAPAYFDHQNTLGTPTTGVMWDGKYMTGANARKVWKDKTAEVQPPVSIDVLLEELVAIEQKEFAAMVAGLAP